MSGSNFIDISFRIDSSTPTWPGHNPVSIELIKSLGKGDGSNLRHFSFTSHSGTHIDAPCHKARNGPSISEIALQVFSGDVIVIEAGLSGVIEPDELEDALASGCPRIIVKTSNSERWAASTDFFSDYVYFSRAAAEKVADSEVRLIGIDALSVDRFGSKGCPVHHIFAENNIVILETVDLHSVRPGKYELFCFPLRVEGSDGSPVRAVLRS